MTNQPLLPEFLCNARNSHQPVLPESQKEEQLAALWQRAFIAAIPGTITAQNWTCNNKPIVTLEARIKLASEAADEAVAIARTKL